MHDVHTRKLNQAIDKENTMEDSDKKNQTDAGVAVRVQKKTRMTMYFEPAILEWFRDQAVRRGAGYQTLINETLRHVLHPDSAPVTVDSLRRVLREEFDRHFGKAS